MKKKLPKNLTRIGSLPYLSANKMTRATKPTQTTTTTTTMDIIMNIPAPVLGISAGAILAGLAFVTSFLQK